MKVNKERGVRKGAWTKEEDNLLKRCVENYGEGKWHLVPVRAGLNRCRKSCRLRWLNYLRPDLKRGVFDTDEIDLIVRLHKLLGNGWSCIAGRIPGRTANDIKNFWNTHFDRKKSPPAAAAASGGKGSRKAVVVKTITESNISRPRPRTFSKIRSCPRDQILLMTKTNENPKINKNPSSSSSFDRSLLLGEGGHTNDDHNFINSAGDHQKDPYKKDPLLSIQSMSSSQDQAEEDECVRWWGDLLEMTGKDGATPLLFPDNPIIGDHQCDANNYAIDGGLISGFSLDVDVWELLRSYDH